MEEREEIKPALDYIEAEYGYTTENFIDTFGYYNAEEFLEGLYKKGLCEEGNEEEMQQEIDDFFTMNNFNLTKRRKRD